MLKYEPLLNHIQIPNPLNAFNVLEQFDTIVFDELKAYHEITKYVISDNKLYYDCFSHCSYYTRFFTEYLNSIVEKN